MANPIVTRSLDEIQFWSRIMKEHALFLRLGFTYEQQQLITEAQQFSTLFERIEEKLARFTVNTDIRQIQAFNIEVYQAAVAIWRYKRKVIGITLRCEIRTNNFPLLVDHVSREAAYFANRLKELNEGKLAAQPETIIQENLFFLKIMADHAKFILWAYRG